MIKNAARRALILLFALSMLVMWMPDARAANATIRFYAQDDLGNAVVGATFALNGTAASPTNATSSSGGEVVFSNVSPGTYYITNTAAPTGYVADSSLRANLVVLDDGDVQYVQDPGQTLIVARARNLKVFPIRDVQGNPVVGAVFNIASSSYSENVTTDSDGLKLELPEGTYTITNVQTPASHMVSGNSLTITVNKNGVYTFSRNPTDAFKLELSRHTLTFTKKDDGGNGVAGAVFHLAGSSLNTTATSGDGGVVTFTGLVPNGTYVLSERTAPSGYTKTSATVAITVDGEGKATWDQDPSAALVNARAKYQLTFTMRNDGGTTVSGAKFKLEGSGTSHTAESELGTGRVLFRDIPFGTYTLTQTSPGEGYPAVTTKITVVIYPDGGISFSQDPAEAFVAERTRYAFSFTAKEERGGALAGATFAVKSGNKDAITAKSDSKGKVSFADLLPGTYTLSQTAVPAGYSASKETVEVKVAEDGKVTFSSPPETTIVATVAKFSVSFDKMDDMGAPVAGAVFRLVGTDYDRTVTTSSSGKVSFPGLLAGTYTLTEQSAPAGYARSGASVTVTVSATGGTSYSREPAVAFTNARSQYELSFVTVDEAGDPIKGAAFALEGGSLRKDAESNRKGRVTFTKLPHGTYIVRQKSAPKGYTRSALTVKVTISAAGFKSYEIIEEGELPNTPISELDGVFVNLSGPASFSFYALSDEQTADGSLKPLSGATFALVNEQSGATVVALSNAAGIVAFYGATPGSYLLGQTQAPPQYAPSTDQYRVTLGAGGEVLIEQIVKAAPAAPVATASDVSATDAAPSNAAPSATQAEPFRYEGTLPEGETLLIPALSFVSTQEKRSFTVLCEDEVSGSPLAGVIFSVETWPAGTSVGMLVTDERGAATLGAVAPGEYRLKPESVPTGYELQLQEGELKVVVPASADPEPVTVRALPIVAEASVAPEGLLATAIDFATNNVAGVAASGAGALLLGMFLFLLLKR